MGAKHCCTLIYRALSDENCKIQKLNLRHNQFNDNEISSKLICMILEKNTSITHIDISENSFIDDGVIKIMNSLRSNQTIIELIMDSIGCKGSPALKELGISISQNRSIKVLSLRNNRIGFHAFREFCKYLKRNETIEEL